MRGMKYTLAKRLSIRRGKKLSEELSNFWAQMIAHEDNNVFGILALRDFPRVNKLVQKILTASDFYSVDTASYYNFSNYLKALVNFYDKCGERRANPKPQLYDFRDAKEALFYAYSYHYLSYLDWEFTAVYPFTSKVCKFIAKLQSKLMHHKVKPAVNNPPRLIYA